MNDFINKLKELAGKHENVTVNVVEVTCPKRQKEVKEAIENNRKYLKEVIMNGRRIFREYAISKGSEA